MEIIVTLSPEGMVSLKCSEDRPWSVLQALRAAADGIVAQQAKIEADSGPKLVLGRALPNGSRG